MNEWDRLHRMAEHYKAEYPSGTRIMLKVKRSLTFEHLGEDMHRVEDNTRGTVLTVDDLGTLHCDFDTGAMIGVVPGEDSFRKLTEEELAEEQEPDMEDDMDEDGPSMRM